MPLNAEAIASPLKTRWRHNQHQWICVAVPLLLFIVLISVVEITVKQETRRAQTTETQNLITNTNQVCTLLEYELNSTLHLTSGLVSYIQSKQGHLLTEDLDPWLANLQEQGKHIRNIGIAPNNKITYLYPLTGNEAAIGLYYPDSEEQWPAVKKTILSRTPVLAGPLELRQGGRGLIYRVPVYLDKTGYWGLISTVLNFDDLYNVIQNRAQQLGIQIAILDLAPDADKQKVLFGDNSLLHHYSQSITLNIPGRQWQMISATAIKHNAESFQNLRMGGWAVALFLSMLLYSFLNSTVKQNITLHELDESQYRFSQAFNTSPQGMALITHQGKWLDFNDSLCNTLEYTREQLQTLTFYKILTQEQQTRISNIIDQNNSTAFHKHPLTNTQHDSVLLNSAGNQINVILSLAPIQANTKNSNWIVQIIDISQRVVVEKLLQEEVYYNQAILNSVVNSIITIDKRGIICSANPATETLFKRNRSQLLQQHINYLFQEPYASNIIQQIKNHVDKTNLNAEINNDIIGIRADGTSFSLELQLSCINRNDEKLFVAVIRDISERKRLERMKNDFISIVSHELRTPLTAILGPLRLLNAGALGTFSEQVQKMIHIAHENGKKLALLIDDLLDMDKLLAGKMQFDFKEQPIYPLVAQSIENNQAYAEQYQVDLELFNATDVLYVKVDGHRLQQVLANLLSNAAKFSPTKSTVSIHISNSSDTVRIEVKDQGVGIPEAAQQKLFEKFYQVDSSNTRPKRGTGLGLAISKELMEAMHGRIGVISKEGKGSCFYLELPLTKHIS